MTARHPGGCGLAAATGPLTFEVLTRPDAVEAVAPEWHALLDRSPCDRAFSSATWFLASCRARPDFAPHVLVARRGRALAGVLPLALAREEGRLVFPSPLADYNDLIAAPGDLEVAVGLLEFVLAQPRGYDRLFLTGLRRDAALIRATEVLQPPIAREEWPFRYPSALLPASGDDFLATRSRRLRKGVRQARRQAERRGLAPRRLEPGELPPERLPQLFLSLHFARFTAASTFRNPSHRRFVEIGLPRLFAEGRLVVLALTAGERVVAIDVYARGAGSLGAWNGGFLPEVASLSPGKLLTAEGVRLACALGLAEYDLLAGTEHYKASWCDRVREVGQLEISCP